MKYMIEFAFAHPYTTFLIGGMVFVGARWALLKLKEALWKVEQIPSHLDPVTGKLHIPTNDTRSSDRYIIDRIIQYLKVEGANIRQVFTDGTGKSSKKKKGKNK